MAGAVPVFRAAGAFAADAVRSGIATAFAGELERGFIAPPDSNKPWVYWYWCDGNITREGITADLEAMKRVSIGGALIFDAKVGNPPGPVRFMTPEWRGMIKYAIAEANRLGLKISINNDAGWEGSGGPWITPEISSQKVVWSETVVRGPGPFNGVLPQPPTKEGYYRDIAMLAFPTPRGDEEGKGYRLKAFEGTKTFGGATDFDGVCPWPNIIPTNVNWPAVPADQGAAKERIVDLTAKAAKDGGLEWDVPEGIWTILRVGHTSTGNKNRPAPKAGEGLECDKLSKAASELHFDSMMGKLIADVGPLAGNTLVRTHVDSWEAGSQNWTLRFPEEFKKRRRYDLLPFLPALTGRMVDSVEMSERFLWDFRETIAELMCENYAGHLSELARKHGLRLSIEAYGGLCDELRYAGRADEPQTEFWIPGFDSVEGWNPLVTAAMASAAHTYGKCILAAEAFTATGDEKWLYHPAMLKVVGDWAFCQGVNRLVIHRYALQPWLNRVPGMCFGAYGQHYERTQTWWKQSTAWHEYLSRCQFLLRQGLLVADICFLQTEGAPHLFVPPIPVPERDGIWPDRSSYDYDACSPEVLLACMQVKDGRLVLPDGMSYRLLVLPTYNADGRPVFQRNTTADGFGPRPLLKFDTMTPALLRRVKELAEAGATVFGTRPLKSPSLAGYPSCDSELQAIADDLWGKGAGVSDSGERKVGRGRIIWGSNPEKVLADLNVPPDFACDAALAGNVRFCHRRLEDATDLYFVANKQQSAVNGIGMFRTSGKRPGLWWPQTGRVQRVAMFEEDRGVTKLPLHLDATESVFVVFRPSQEMIDPVVLMTYDGQIFTASPQKIVVETATLGVPGDAARTRDVKAQVQSILDGGETSFPVYWLLCGGDSEANMVKTLSIEYTIGDNSYIVTATDSETIHFMDSGAPQPPAGLQFNADGRLQLEAWKNGRYEFKTAAGKTMGYTVADLPAPTEIIGPWEVRFPPKLGAPAKITLARLISWSNHSDVGVKHFSGTATYTKTLALPVEMIAKDYVLYLDLGRVEVIAQVKVNGKDLGILWKAPFCVEITEAVKSGENRLEVQVTNLWVNRMIGDEQLPEDSDRDEAAVVKSWPKWLEEGQPSPTGRITFASFRMWNKNSPLQDSGLLGPVRLFASERALLQ